MLLFKPFNIKDYQKRIGHPYQNRNPPKRKKPRTSFNRPQIVELEKRFIKQKYLASSERSSLAKLLQMTDAQVYDFLRNFLILIKVIRTKTLIGRNRYNNLHIGSKL